MLGWIVIFVMTAVLAAIVGFTGVVAAAATFAKVVFWILLVLFLTVLIMSLVGQNEMGGAEENDGPVVRPIGS